MHGAQTEHARCPFRARAVGCTSPAMPSKYDREATLPLRVPRELRARLDAVRALVPAPLTLPRNSVAVAALARGLDALAAELARDPTAVHRALAGSTSTGAADTSTGSSSDAAGQGEHARSTHAARTEHTPSTPRARSKRAPSKARARTEHTPPAKALDGEALDAAAVLVRFLAAEVKVATFARAHGIVRSTLQMWAAGKRPLNAKALARVVRGLDVEGK